MGDYDALMQEIKTNPRYTAAYQRGSNSTLTSLLNQRDTGRTIPAVRRRREVLNALAGFLRELTVDEQGALELIIGSDDVRGPGIDFANATVVQAVKELWRGKPSQTEAATSLDAISSRPATFGDAFGFPNTTLQDVRETQRRDPDSYLNKYNRGEVGTNRG